MTKKLSIKQHDKRYAPCHSETHSMEINDFGYCSLCAINEREKAIKIPVRYEDVEAFREEMRLNGALEFMDGYDYGRAEEIKKVDLWLKNTINILIVLSAGFLLGTLLIMIFK
jgi:hypothetical protein